MKKRKYQSTKEGNPILRKDSQQQSDLHLLGGDRCKYLAELGLRNLHDLLNYEPLRSARILSAVSKGLMLPPPPLDHLVKNEYMEDDPVKAISWPVTALLCLTDADTSALNKIGIKTIGDLAQLGREADEAILITLEDNGFYERPSAPNVLLPGLIGSAASSTRFATFIRKTELRKLKFVIDHDCIVELPISGRLTGAGKPNSILDLFNRLRSAGNKELLQKLNEVTNSQKLDGKELAKILSDFADVRDVRDTDKGSLSSIFENQKCPILYLGYMCDHRQNWINVGTHLGEVVHSISLAPGESRNIALVNWRRRQLTALEENTTLNEQLTANFIQNRAIEEITTAVAREHQGGKTQTEANTAVTAESFVAAGSAMGGAALGVTGAIVGGLVGSMVPGVGTAIGSLAGGAAGAAVGAAAGVAAGGLVYAGTQALGMIEADTDGNREIIADVHQRISLSTSQAASAVRSLWSTVVVEDTQAEGVDATTSNITNYNHMHALNIEYYEVLQRYLVRTELQGVQPILFLPFTFFDFTNFKFVRDYWDIVRNYIDDEQLKKQGDMYFVQEEVPSAPDLLPPVPQPQKPGDVAPFSIENLELDVYFYAHGVYAGFLSKLKLSVVANDPQRGEVEFHHIPPPGDLSDPDEKGQRFKFDIIPNAEMITAVRIFHENTEMGADVVNDQVK